VRSWSVFFGTVTAIIVMTMALPDLFGFVRIAQWGGMYTDGWCQGTVKTIARDDASKHIDHGFTVSNIPAVRAVWYAPQFTDETCVAWVQRQCGTARLFGETVVEAYAMRRHQWLEHSHDLCSIPPVASAAWFPSNP
jgi:hypothetical protein